MWLEMATVVIEMLSSDWLLAIAPDGLAGTQEWTEVAGLRWIREVAEQSLAARQGGRVKAASRA